MKLCWEFINDLVLKTRQDGQKVFYHYYGVPNYRLCDSQWIEEEHCAWCNEPYLRRINSKSKYCDNDCKKAHTEWKKEQKKIENKIENKHRVYKNRKGHKWSEEAKINLHKVIDTLEYKEKHRKAVQENILKGKDSPVWKGGVSKSYLTSYDTYINRIPLSIRTRRSPENEYILQTICKECGKWFSPNKKVVQQKICGKIDWIFNCSPKCVGKSRIGKSYASEETIRLRKDKHILKQKEKQLKEIQKENNHIALLYKKDKRIRGIIYRYNKRIERNQLKEQKLLSYIKCKEEKQIVIESFKKDYPERYKKCNKNKVSLWFEIKRYQSPIEWRIQRMLVLATKRAKQKGWKINITKDWIRERIDKCEATGIPFDNGYEGTFITMNPYAPSIDRIDSNKGYTMDNCRLVLTTFNSLKSSLSDYELYINLKQFIKYYSKMKNETGC